MSDNKPKSKKKLIALLAAGALIIGAGATATILGISNYNAETEALCVAALDDNRKALDAQQAATQAADAALETVKSTKLPKDGGTSAEYAKRPVVEAVKAQAAKDGKPEVKSVDARQSGADFIKDVTEAREKLTKLDAATKCTDRDQAAAIEKRSKSATVEVTKLETATEALLADFAVFQKDEAARIAAEKKAAEEKAAAEKAAAEQAAAEAARIAAEQAAAEAAWAAQQPQYTEPSYGGGGGYTPPATGGGGGGGSYTPPPATGGGGGGGGGGGTIIDPGFGGGGCPEGMTCFG